MSLNATLHPHLEMPLWPGLGKSLADELQDYTPTGVLDAISAYGHEFGRARLIERLAELLHVNRAQPGRAHKEFCSLPLLLMRAKKAARDLHKCIPGRELPERTRGGDRRERCCQVAAAPSLNWW